MFESVNPSISIYHIDTAQLPQAASPSARDTVKASRLSTGYPYAGFTGQRAQLTSG